MTCNACPNPANCSPTFCHFEEAESVSVTATSGDSPVFWLSAVETPHDKAPALPVTMFDKPARHVRALDWVGNTSEHALDLCRAAWYWVCSVSRDVVEVLPSLLVASGVVLACVFAAGVVVGFAK